jgi:hypothetical protein
MFDVSMDDALAMCRHQSLANLNREIDSLLNRRHVSRRTAAGDEFTQRLAFEKFHGNERVTLVFCDFVNGADVRVVQRGCRAGLLSEALQCVGIARQFLGENLQRDVALQLQVLGLVNHPHPAAAEDLQDSVVGHFFAGEVARDRDLRLRIGRWCW